MVCLAEQASNRRAQTAAADPIEEVDRNAVADLNVVAARIAPAVRTAVRIWEVDQNAPVAHNVVAALIDAATQNARAVHNAVPIGRVARNAVQVDSVPSEVLNVAPNAAQNGLRVQFSPGEPVGMVVH